jgi:hypothetical protein
MFKFIEKKLTIFIDNRIKIVNEKIINEKLKLIYNNIDEKLKFMDELIEYHKCDNLMVSSTLNTDSWSNCNSRSYLVFSKLSKNGMSELLIRLVNNYLDNIVDKYDFQTIYNKFLKVEDNDRFLKTFEKYFDTIPSKILNKIVKQLNELQLKK